MAKTKFLAKCLILAIFASTLSTNTARAAQDVWEPITPAEASGTFTAVASMGDYVYLGTTQGIYRSADQGAHWDAVTLSTSTVNSIAIGWGFDLGNLIYTADANTPVFVATNNGVYKSTLGSNSWTLTGQTSDMLDIEFDQYQAIFNTSVPTIYTGGASGVYRSDDLGNNWTLVSASSTKKVVTDFISDGSSGNVYTITQDNTVNSSPLYSVTATNENWNEKLATSTTINDLAPVYMIDGGEFLATERGVMKSNDYGATWNFKNFGLANPVVMSIQNDFINTNIVYIAASSSGIYKSTNGGAPAEEWLPANSGLGGSAMKIVNTNPASSTLVYAASDRHIFRLSLSDSLIAPNTDTTPPSQVPSLTFSNNTATSTTLHWTAPGNDGSIGTAANYDIRYSTSTITDLNWNNAAQSVMELPAQPAGTQESLTQNGLQPNTTYHFVIKTTDGSGNLSIISPNFSTTTLPDLIAPSTPSDIGTTTISTSQINISWASSTDNINTTGYNIYKNGNLIASTTTLNYSDTGLSAGTTYNYQIAAFDAAGNESVKSTTTSATTQAASVPTPTPSPAPSGGGVTAIVDTTAPNVPRYVGIERKNNSVKLIWTNPTDSDLGEIVVIKRETEATSSAYALTSIGAKMTIVGTSTSYTEPDTDPAKKLFYYIYAKDKSGNISSGLAMIAPLQISTAVSTNSSTTTLATTTKPINTYEDSVRAEASIVYSQTAASKLSDAEIKTYNTITKGEVLDGNAKYAIAYFIKNGTVSTIKLGAGERAGSVSSYRKAFGHLPKTTEDWMDVIKIGNGRWTKENSVKAEADSARIFKIIYKRTPNLKNVSDNSAIKVMTYGLRPSLRNQNSEKAAIRSFKAIFRKVPTLATDWDIIRTIAYSGAKR